MISVLAQERLLGAALGTVFTSFVVFEQRKCIYKSISDDRSPVSTKPVVEPIFGKQYRSELACVWNKAVDQTFGPVIASLSSRKW